MLDRAVARTGPRAIGARLAFAPAALAAPANIVAARQLPRERRESSSKSSVLAKMGDLGVDKMASNSTVQGVECALPAVAHRWTPPPLSGAYSPRPPGESPLLFTLESQRRSGPSSSPPKPAPICGPHRAGSTLATLCYLAPPPPPRRVVSPTSDVLSRGSPGMF